MSLLCAANCQTIVEDVPINYHDICLGDILRKAGWKQFVLVKCNLQFTDVLDPAEWATHLAAGDVGVSPEGTLNFNPPAQASFPIDGCGRTAPDETSLLIDYFTYQTKEDLSDFVYWKSFFRRAASFRIMPVDCNGIFYVSDNFATAIAAGSPATVAGESPGLEFSVPQIPIPLAGANPNFVSWTTQIQIDIVDVPCGVYLPGVLDALVPVTP